MTLFEFGRNNQKVCLMKQRGIQLSAFDDKTG